MEHNRDSLKDVETFFRIFSETIGPKETSFTEFLNTRKMASLPTPSMTTLIFRLAIPSIVGLCLVALWLWPHFQTRPHTLWETTDDMVWHSQHRDDLWRLNPQEGG